MKFRLLATIITLAAVITATNSTNAQRRSTATSTNNEKVENNRSGNKSNIEKKSTFREIAKQPQTNNRSVKSSQEVKRHNSPTNKGKRSESGQTSARSGGNNKSDRSAAVSKSNQNVNTDRERTGKGTYNESKDLKSNSDRAVAKTSDMSRRSTGYTTDSKSNDSERYNSNRTRTGNITERYNHNADDIRYKPNREYKGSDKYWSSDFRGDKRNNNYKGNQKYHNYKHWDRNWENYRWNHNSWRKYYGYYNPYSYRNHKHYYHHNYYGHVIRRFVHRPQIYIHNHTRYYCYDGFFFRYRSGIGYVLVDVPFGMTFEFLPNDYERVFVNGYLYFRVGNLFFERSNNGYQLVHYPERYFTYNNDYYSGGYRFNDMNF